MTIEFHNDAEIMKWGLCGRWNTLPFDTDKGLPTSFTMMDIRSVIESHFSHYLRNLFRQTYITKAKKISLKKSLILFLELTGIQVKWFWRERARSKKKKLARTVRGQTQPTVRAEKRTVRV